MHLSKNTSSTNKLLIFKKLIKLLELTSLISLGLVYTLSVSAMIRESNLDWILNFEPNIMKFGLIQGIGLSVGVIGLAMLIRLHDRYKLIFVLLVVGVLSNLVEFLVFENVVDYIDIIIAKLNIPDILIYITIVFLILKRNTLFPKTIKPATSEILNSNFALSTSPSLLPSQELVQKLIQKSNLKNNKSTNKNPNQLLS